MIHSDQQPQSYQLKFLAQFFCQSHLIQAKDMPVLHHSLQSGLPIVRNCDGTVLHDGQKIRRFLRCGVGGVLHSLETIRQ